jgi:hypothetical protein
LGAGGLRLHIIQVEWLAGLLAGCIVRMPSPISGCIAQVCDDSPLAAMQSEVAAATEEAAQAREREAASTDEALLARVRGRRISLRPTDTPCQLTLARFTQLTLPRTSACTARSVASADEACSASAVLGAVAVAVAAQVAEAEAAGRAAEQRALDAEMWVQLVRAVSVERGGLSVERSGLSVERGGLSVERGGYVS